LKTKVEGIRSEYKDLRVLHLQQTLIISHGQAFAAGAAVSAGVPAHHRL